MSVATMFATFSLIMFFGIDENYKHVLIAIHTVTCLPLILFVVSDFPLYIDLVRGIATTVPQSREKEDDE